MIQKVVHSFGSLTGIRILSRVFQFILKTYLIRTMLDKEIVGHMLQLDLIITVSLHIVKSCLKPAYQKVSNSSQLDKNVFSGMNLMSLGIFSTIIVSLIVSGLELYHYQNTQSDKRLPNLNYAIILYGLSAVNEALYEKFNVHNVLKYEYVKCGLIEMGSFLPKTLFIFIAAQMGFFGTWGIAVFGFGHFIYTSLLFIISYVTNPKIYRNIFPVKIKDDQTPSQTILIDKKTKQSAKQFFTLSLLKLAIQQFQKIALVTLDISSFSSTYTLISNLGSIVVRYVFAPLQEVVYNFFSRGEEKESVRTLILLIKSITLFSCLSLTFGYNFSQAFLGLLYGERWVDADSVSSLQIYTVLLSFFGINGIMEAFLFAKGGKSFKNYKYISIFPTAVYILLSFYLIHFLNMGTKSFFLANTASMIIRIVISWNLEIKKHISLGNFIAQIKPSAMFLFSLILTFLVGNPLVPHIGLQRFGSHFKDMILGGLLFGINILVIAYQNRTLFKEKISTILRKKQKKQ